VNATTDIVQKLWNLCHVLRDDGITYLQYVTELTYLLFLKMAQETGGGRPIALRDALGRFDGERGDGTIDILPLSAAGIGVKSFIATGASNFCQCSNGDSSLRCRSVQNDIVMKQNDIMRLTQ
jgi:hypothetical protein